MKYETQSDPKAEALVDSELERLLERPYKPPELFIFEEVELGSGYHTLDVCWVHEERDWSERYTKSGVAEYRNRIVRVPYPPQVSGVSSGSESRE